MADVGVTIRCRDRERSGPSHLHQLRGTSAQQADVTSSASAPPSKMAVFALSRSHPKGKRQQPSPENRGRLPTTLIVWLAGSVQPRAPTGKRRLAEGEEGAPSRKDGAVGRQARHRCEEGPARCTGCRQRQRPKVHEPAAEGCYKKKPCKKPSFLLSTSLSRPLMDVLERDPSFSVPMQRGAGLGFFLPAMSLLMSRSRLPRPARDEAR
jgi:hypothetical protein